MSTKSAPVVEEEEDVEGQIVAESNAQGLALVKRALIDKRLVENDFVFDDQDLEKRFAREKLQQYAAKSRDLFLFANQRLDQNHDAILKLEPAWSNQESHEAAVTDAASARAAAAAAAAREEEGVLVAQAAEVDLILRDIGRNEREAQVLESFAAERESITANLVALHARRENLRAEAAEVTAELERTVGEEEKRVTRAFEETRARELARAIEKVEETLAPAAKVRIRMRAKMEAEVSVHRKESAKLERSNTELRAEIDRLRADLRAVREATTGAAQEMYALRRLRPDEDAPDYDDDELERRLEEEDRAARAENRVAAIHLAALHGDLDRKTREKRVLTAKIRDLEEFFARCDKAPNLLEARALLFASKYVLRGPARALLLEAERARPHRYAEALSAVVAHIGRPQRVAFLDLTFAALRGDSNDGGPQGAKGGAPPLRGAAAAAFFSEDDRHLGDSEEDEAADSRRRRHHLGSPLKTVRSASDEEASSLASPTTYTVLTGDANSIFLDEASVESSSSYTARSPLSDEASRASRGAGTTRTARTYQSAQQSLAQSSRISGDYSTVMLPRVVDRRATADADDTSLLSIATPASFVSFSVTDDLVKPGKGGQRPRRRRGGGSASPLRPPRRSSSPLAEVVGAAEPPSSTRRPRRVAPIDVPADAAASDTGSARSSRSNRSVRPTARSLRSFDSGSSSSAVSTPGLAGGP